ncbi:hypothetical protein [Chryseolinea lacunae]|uniref:Uncharacterized protein n=1 Tax=Chryseolinea lacunae TaxID=2801331 RepID=A0ABS1KPX5_9BACT|nr:hypothetical protein [Chryseolinea lacunae]MBL0741365.1 hypothetical protein [Chryseolinea lacunae]
MSRKADCFDELEAAKYYHQEIIEFYETCKYGNPKKFMNTRMSSALHALRAIYEKSYLDIYEQIIVPTLGKPVDMDKVHISFPRADSLSGFQADNTIKLLAPLHADITSILESVQPYNNPHIKRLFYYSGKSGHNRPMTEAKEAHGLSIGDVKITDEWNSTFYFGTGKNAIIDCQYSNPFKNLVLVNSENASVLQGVFNSVIIVNCHEFDLAHSFIENLSLVNSSGLVYGNTIRGHKQINSITVKFDKLTFEPTAYDVVNGQKIPVNSFASVEAEIFQEIYMKNLTRFYFEATELEILSFIGVGIMFADKYLNDIYSILK